MIDYLAYIASAVIIGTYFLTTNRRPLVWFHWANFIGAFFTGASTIIHHAYPSLILTVAFGTIGCVGVVKSRFRKNPQLPI